MKTQELIKLLKKNKCYILRNGSRHDIWYSRTTRKQFAVPRQENEFVNYVVCDTMAYRKMYNGKAVKKTLTLPAWLNEEAASIGINFSQVLQEALLQRLQLR